MSTNFQSVDSQLEKIKGTLKGISSSLSVSTPEQRTQLANAFDSLKGTLSSEQARRSVSSAQTNSPGTSSSKDGGLQEILAITMQQKAAAERRAKEAEAKKKEAEATASIADQRMLKNQIGKTGSSSTAGVDSAPVDDKKMAFQNLMQIEPMLGEYGLTEENLQDPMIVATLRNQVARSQQIEADALRLNEMVAKKERRTQEQVAMIGASVKNQEAQLKVEQRKRMAAEGMAGILSGRSLYSPEEHQGLIQEVVQEGILKLQEIQLEGYKLQNEMWDDFDNYEFEAYSKKSEMLKEYNKLELDTVTAIQERLQAVAKFEQEKLVFDQEQMDRASLILAEELVGASDDAIREAAISQGVDYGLLKRAVADATFTQEERDLTIQNKQADLKSKEADLANKWATYNKTFADMKESGEDEKPFDSSARKDFKENTGWTVPVGMTPSTAYAIEGITTLSANEKEEYALLLMSNQKQADEYFSTTLENKDFSNDETIVDGNQSLKNLYEAYGDEFGGNWKRLITKGDFKLVFNNDVFKETYVDEAKKVIENKENISQAEFLKRVAESARPKAEREKTNKEFVNKIKTLEKFGVLPKTKGDVVIY